MKLLRRALAGLLAAMLLVTSASALSVEDALALLEERYVYAIPSAAYSAGSLDELFALIEDPYTYYMTAEEYQAFLDSVEGDDSVTGIGAGITFTDQGILVASILPGSGAEEAGLKPGDRIIAVEGTSCVPADESHRALITGKAGTFVSLTVLREDGAAAELTIERRYIEIHNTNISLQDGVGMIDCDSFGTETGTYFKEGITQKNDDAHIWIVDLRSNSGGVTSSAIDALGTFAGSGPLLYFRDRNGKYFYNLCFDDPLTENPAIVLTNGYSASASEVFAAGIRDRAAGISVGSRTYGKGVAQTILDKENTPALFDGDAMKVTIYRFYSPDGLTTDKIGVIPTLLVDNAHVQAVAQLLCAREPEKAEDYLRLELAGWTFYVDCRPEKLEEYGDSLSILLSALPPDAAIALGDDGKWVPVTTAMATTIYDAHAFNRWFSDVSGSPYAEAINTLATYGILQGDSSRLFHPESTLTRAQLCAMLSHAFDLTSTSAAPFSDVPQDSWYAGAVNAMSALGLINGKGNGLFCPQALVTQEEFITVMGRLASYLNFHAYEYAQSLSPQDLAANSSLAALAPWAKTGGAMMTGMMLDAQDNPINLLYAPLSEIVPSAPITREQAAATLCSILKTMGVIVY